MSKVHIAIDRANAGTAFDIFEKALDAYEAGQPLDEFAAQEIADRAIERYQKHVRAGLARAGVELAEGEKLDSAALLRIIESRTGLEIRALTPEAVSAAVQGQISARISASLGVEVEGITNGEQLKAALITMAKNAVQTGRGNALITRAMIKRLRALKAWQTSGIDQLERQRMLNRAYQKEYRRTHKEVWVGAASGGSGEYGYPNDP